MEESEKFSEVVQKIIEVNPSINTAAQLIEVLSKHIVAKNGMKLLKQGLHDQVSPLNREADWWKKNN